MLSGDLEIVKMIWGNKEGFEERVLWLALLVKKEIITYLHKMKLLSRSYTKSYVMYLNTVDASGWSWKMETFKTDET